MSKTISQMMTQQNDLVQQIEELDRQAKQGKPEDLVSRFREGRASAEEFDMAEVMSNLDSLAGFSGELRNRAHRSHNAGRRDFHLLISDVLGDRLLMAQSYSRKISRLEEKLYAHH